MITERLRGGDLDRFIQTQVGEEILLYERATGQTHLLPMELARVYKRLDGRSCIEIAQSAFPDTPVTESVTLVEAAAQQLLEKGLVDIEGGIGISRRDFVAGAVKAAALPTILSVVAGQPAAAASFAATCGVDLVINTPGTHTVAVPICPNGQMRIYGAPSSGGGGGGGASFGANAGGAGGIASRGFPFTAVLYPLAGATSVTVIIGAGGEGGAPGSIAGSGGMGGAGGTGLTTGADGADGQPGVGAGGGGGQGGQGGQSKIEWGASQVVWDGGLGGGGGGGASVNGPGSAATATLGGAGNPPGGDGGGPTLVGDMLGALGGSSDTVGQPGYNAVVRLTFL